MKNFHRQKLFSVVAKWLCVLLAVLALPVNVFAQPKSPERWLFIFDLSPTMKKRLPATEAALKNFFASAVRRNEWPDEWAARVVPRQFSFAFFGERVFQNFSAVGQQFNRAEIFFIG